MEQIRLKLYSFWVFLEKNCCQKIFFSDRILNPETMNKLENMKEQGKKLTEQKYFTRDKKTTYDIGDAIRNAIITMDMPNDKQDELAEQVTSYQ